MCSCYKNNVRYYSDFYFFFILKLSRAGIQNIWLFQHWHQQGLWYSRNQIQEGRVRSDLHREVEHWQHIGNRNHNWRSGIKLLRYYHLQLQFHTSAHTHMLWYRTMFCVKCLLLLVDCKGTEVDFWHNLLTKHWVRWWLKLVLCVWRQDWLRPLCMSNSGNLIFVAHAYDLCRCQPCDQGPSKERGFSNASLSLSAFTLLCSDSSAWKNVFSFSYSTCVCLLKLESLLTFSY